MQLNANQTVDNYWVRANPNFGNVGFTNGINSAILRYDGAAAIEPTTNQTANVSFFDALNTRYSGFTLLSPTNTAIDAANGTLQSLASNTTAVNNVLFNHVRASPPNPPGTLAPLLTCCLVDQRHNPLLSPPHRLLELHLCRRRTTILLYQLHRPIRVLGQRHRTYRSTRCSSPERCCPYH